MTTTTDTEQLHAEFEAWHAGKYGTPIFDDELGRFIPTAVQNRWEAYQAGRTALQSQDRDAMIEAVRKQLCALPRYSFITHKGGVSRVHDRTGNWIEFDQAHALFDPVNVDHASRIEGGMSYPEWGTALIECANPPYDWRGLETDMIPDPAPKVAPRGRLTHIEKVCPRCKRPGYYFVEETK